MRVRRLVIGAAAVGVLLLGAAAVSPAAVGDGVVGNDAVDDAVVDDGASNAPRIASDGSGSTSVDPHKPSRDRSLEAHSARQMTRESFEELVLEIVGGGPEWLERFGIPDINSVGYDDGRRTMDVCSSARVDKYETVVRGIPTKVSGGCVIQFQPGLPDLPGMLGDETLAPELRMEQVRHPGE